jgi:hypothetical protein
VRVDKSPDEEDATGASPAPVAIPRLQLNAWRDALARAATIPAVIEVVQRILGARWTDSPELPSVWQPRDIRSREDIEHWARRIQSRPSGRPGMHALAPLCDLMRIALDRMNELGPKRR